jgi:hypothetical protein
MGLGFGFTFNFSGSDDERDETSVDDYEQHSLLLALDQIADEAKRLADLLQKAEQTPWDEHDYTVTTRTEAAALAAAVDVIEQRYRDEDLVLPGDLRNLRYRLRNRRF